MVRRFLPARARWWVITQTGTVALFGWTNTTGVAGGGLRGALNGAVVGGLGAAVTFAVVLVGWWLLSEPVREEPAR